MSLKKRVTSFNKSGVHSACCKWSIQYWHEYARRGGMALFTRLGRSGMAVLRTRESLRSQMLNLSISRMHASNARPRERDCWGWMSIWKIELRAWSSKIPINYLADDLDDLVYHLCQTKMRIAKEFRRTFIIMLDRKSVV